jgi:hypothetical protein
VVGTLPEPRALWSMEGNSANFIFATFSAVREYAQPSSFCGSVITFPVHGRLEVRREQDHLRSSLFPFLRAAPLMLPRWRSWAV